MPPVVALAATLAGLSAFAPASALTGSWPVDDPVIVSGYRPPGVVWGAGHRGIDLASGTGTDIRAVADGVVAVAGLVAGKPVVTVALPGPGRRRVTYEPVLARVRPGDVVTAGQVLGVLAAAGGHCGGVTGCLHLGLRTATGYSDPLTLIQRLPAVLKPRGASRLRGGLR